jgi:integrase
MKQSRGSKLTKRIVDAAAPAPSRYTLWDGTLPGFGVTVSPAGTKTFMVRYRPKKSAAPKRFMSLGRFGPITVEEARDKAMKIMGAVANGEDPAATLAEDRASRTVGNAAEEFLTEHVATKRKPTTAASYRHTFSCYIVPKFGQRKLRDLTKMDVARLHSSLQKTPSAANRVVAVLGSLYGWAGRRGWVPEGCNPTMRLEKFREQRRERFLGSDELKRLGDALREAETTGIPWAVDEGRPTAKHLPQPDKRLTVVSPFAVAAIRLLLFTGCRRGEVLNLRWEDVDFERGVAMLPDSKTGRKPVLLGAPALRVLADLPRVGPYVIAGDDPARPRADLKRPWDAIRKRAGLQGVRVHDLRHSFASIGAGAGLGLPVIGRLLGHTQPSTTARYAHLADDPLRRASEMISQSIAEAMGDGTPSKKAPLVELRKNYL